MRSSGTARSRDARAQARPGKPAGLALSVTLLATLLAGGYVSRMHPSHAAGLTLPGPTAGASGLSKPSAVASNATGSWRSTDAVPRPAPALHPSPDPTSAPAPSAPPPAAGSVTINRSAGDWVSWALLDRRTGAITTGGDAGTNTTESMIKAWIVADYLRGLGGNDPSAAETDLMRRAIRDSNDEAAETLYLRRGNDAVINRMISTCGLTDTSVYHGWWSLTQVSARDAVRMGDCIADGKATNARWTAWLLNEMRQVRGDGRFGIVQVQPGAAIKNGWTLQGDGTWHVNCLGVTDTWTLSVLTRYPSGYGLDHGAEICRQVTRQLPLS